MNLDDPKLTAFALNELDATEREEVEQFLAEHPEAAAEIATIEETATLLRNTLAHEAPGAFTEEQRANIFAALGQTENADPLPALSPSGWHTPTPLWLHIAAAILIVGVSAYLLLRHFESPTKVNSRSLAANTSQRSEGILVATEAEKAVVTEGAPFPEILENSRVYQAPGLIASSDLPPQLPIASSRIPTPPIRIAPEPAMRVTPAVPTLNPTTKSRIVKAEDQPSKSLRILPAQTAQSLINPQIKLPSRIQVSQPPLGAHSESASKLSLAPSVSPVVQTSPVSRELSQFTAVAQQPLCIALLNSSKISFAQWKQEFASNTMLPPAIQVLTNAFDYHYQEPKDNSPLELTVESASCPWEPSHHLVLVAIQAKKHGDEIAARQVLLRVDFNPLKASGYRLLSRDIQAASAGISTPLESSILMRGDSITAMFEVIPAGVHRSDLNLEESRYQPKAKAAVELAHTLPPEIQAELLTVSLRFLAPQSRTESVIEKSLLDLQRNWTDSSPDFRWAAGATGFGLLIQAGEEHPALNWGILSELLGTPSPEERDRLEFVNLVQSLGRH